MMSQCLTTGVYRFFKTMLLILLYIHINNLSIHSNKYKLNLFSFVLNKKKIGFYGILLAVAMLALASIVQTTMDSTHIQLYKSHLSQLSYLDSNIKTPSHTTCDYKHVSISNVTA